MKAYIVRFTVATESGARYSIRSHGERAYVTRLGDVPMYGNPPVNRVITDPIPVFRIGQPMVIPGVVQTTPVVSIDHSIEVYG